MTITPIVARELSVQARRSGTYWTRIIAAVISGLVMAWLLMISGAPIPVTSQGKMLFSSLSIITFIYSLFVGAFLTADCLSAEKRDGTLGLLFLTDLRGYDVVFGKLVSSSVQTAYALLAILPVISIGTLFGGVTANELWRTVLVVGNTMFFSLSAGMLASTLSRNDRKAVFATVLAILMMAFVPYLVGTVCSNLLMTGRVADAEPFFLPSPVFAFWLAQQSMFTAARMQQLVQSVAWTHALAWVFLVLSFIIIPRACKDRPKGKRREGWTERWRQWTLGDRTQRASYRRRLLDRNPCLWLSGRDRYRPLLAWVLIVPLTGVSIWIYLWFPLVFYETSLILIAIVQVLLKVWFTGEVCHRWIEDRRNGALELILCSPLRAEEIIQGQGMALRRQFGWPAAAVLALSFAAWYGIVQSSGRGSNTQFGRDWLFVTAPIFFTDVIALRWVATWTALRARGLNRAIAGSLGKILGLRWLVYVVFGGLAYALVWIGFPTEPFLWGPIFWFWLALALDIAFGVSARRHFIKYFRAIAANPSNYRDDVVLEAAPAETKVEPASAPSAAPKHLRRWRVGTKVAIGLGILFVAAVGFQSAYRWWLGQRIEAVLSGMQRAGVSLTIDEITRKRAPFQGRTDAAETVARAYAALKNSAGDWFQFPPHIRNNLPGFSIRTVAVCGEPLPDAMRNAIGTVLSSNASALKIVREAPSLRAGRYSLDRKAETQLALQSQGLWRVSELLRYQTLLQGDDGDMKGAVDSLRLMFDLGHSLDGDNALLYYRTRDSIFLRGISTMEWLMSRHSLRESQIEMLFSKLQDAEGPAGLSNAVVNLRCLAVEWYRSPPKKPAPTRRSFGAPSTSELIRFEMRNRVRHWTGAKHREMLALLSLVNELGSVALLRPHDRFQAGQELQKRSELFFEGSELGPFGAKTFFDQSIVPDTEFTARVRAALTALAIERFRLRNDGKLPQNLEPIAGQYLREIPVDPFDGQPLRYKLKPKGYIVYSVGRNGRDDDGFETTGPASETDIVFKIVR